MSNSIPRILSTSLVLLLSTSCGAPSEDNAGNGSGIGGTTPGTGGTAAVGGNSGVGGTTGVGGATATGGAAGVGGAVGVGGATTGGATGTGGEAATGGSTGTGGGAGVAKFSFFATSLKAIVATSGSEDGFGGDLRHGETGMGAGLRGADKICTEIAESSMPGNGKTWRAFLSAHQGDDGNPVNAIDRIGEGPWYDRLERLVANSKADLQNTRPMGAHADIINDLPNEDGVPNHNPDGMGKVDNHQFLTGSNTRGELFSDNTGSTCDSWTSTVGTQSGPKPRMGHSWPRSSEPFNGVTIPPCTGEGTMPCGDHWISAFDGPGCAAGVELEEHGPAQQGDYFVGAAGGYGGFYCFALTP